MKQLYKDEHLQFVSHLIAKEVDYVIDHATETTTHELIFSGNMEELWDLFNNVDEDFVTGLRIILATRHKPFHWLQTCCSCSFGSRVGLHTGVNSISRVGPVLTTQNWTRLDRGNTMTSSSSL